MKAKYIIKGFIDPRREDTITINFDLDQKVYDSSRMFGIVRMMDASSINLPEIYGREKWIEVNGEKINHISGSGPEPKHTIPKGDIVNIILNI